MSGPYDDIISLPHPTSSRHPRMPISDRAAQFSPFAALAGHSAALAETARLTDRQIELSDDDKAVLDQKQRILLEHIKECPEITVTWFRPDEKKDGGQYITTTGRLRRIDEFNQVLILVDDINTADPCGRFGQRKTSGYEPDGMVIHKEPAIDQIAGSFYESRISQGRSSVLMGGLLYKEALA